jgi:hypothetical protein
VAAGQIDLDRFALRRHDAGHALAQRAQHRQVARHDAETSGAAGKARRMSPLQMLPVRLVISSRIVRVPARGLGVPGIVSIHGGGGQANPIAAAAN